MNNYVPDERRARVWRELPLPTDRPATKREVWEHYHAIFFDFKGHKTTPICTGQCNHRSPGELEAYCRDAWVWDYVNRFLGGKTWDKQPDWKEGVPVIPEAVLQVRENTPLAGNLAQLIRTVQELHQTALQLLPERQAA